MRIETLVEAHELPAGAFALCATACDLPAAHEQMSVLVVADRMHFDGAASAVVDEVQHSGLAKRVLGFIDHAPILRAVNGGFQCGRWTATDGDSAPGPPTRPTGATALSIV